MSAGPEPIQSIVSEEKRPQYVVLVRDADGLAAYAIGAFSEEGARRFAVQHPVEVKIPSTKVEVVPLFPPDPVDLMFVQPDHPAAP